MTITRLLAAIFISAVALFAQTIGQPINVPIQNPSFEQVSQPFTSGSCGQNSNGNAPGWFIESGSGIFKPTVPAPPGCHAALPVPDGSNVAFLQSSILQDTGVKAADLQRGSVDGIYTLQFYVTNYFSVYPGYYAAKILLGTPQQSGPPINMREMCEVDGWATQRWTKVTMLCPSPAYIVIDQWPDGSAIDPNAHLIVGFYGNRKYTGEIGWELLIDDVSPLTFTPQS